MLSRSQATELRRRSGESLNPVFLAVQRKIGFRVARARAAPE
jgi:hypothetical protein